MFTRLTLTALFTLIFLAAISPGPLQAVDWVSYGSDAEGKHYYDRSAIVQAAGIANVQTAVVYTSEGRTLYLARRQKAGMSNKGLEQVHYRVVRYDINCFSNRKEFATLEVWELSREGKTLDYARTGGYKDWHDVPEGTPLEQLYKAVCPARR